MIEVRDTVRRMSQDWSLYVAIDSLGMAQGSSGRHRVID